MHNFDVWRATYHRSIHLLVAYMGYQPDHPDWIIIFQELKFSVCAAPKKRKKERNKKEKRIALGPLFISFTTNTTTGQLLCLQKHKRPFQSSRFNSL